ncbi:MAG TPA: hypothetical protein PLF01_04640 [Alphaproteobacteria bacterium]|nr:hypothetical protein [Alphaproteobacteria bacterium]
MKLEAMFADAFGKASELCWHRSMKALQIAEEKGSISADSAAILRKEYAEKPRLAIPN